MESAARGDGSMERKKERTMPALKAASKSKLMLSGAQMLVGRQQVRDIVDNNNDTTGSLDLNT